ncbi:MAG: hypothetical protein LBQ63_05580 [Deltaproteobacteria bacterium]|jgi:hypothetical protein|nr:hypothetical protein [Deltaproteobacteria bacterium]
MKRSFQQIFYWCRLLIVFALFPALAACGRPPLADDSPQYRDGHVTVAFAGVSFTGDFKDNKKNYPYSYEIVTRTAKDSLDRILGEKLLARAAGNPNVSFHLGLLNMEEAAEAIAVSFAIDLEKVSVSEIAEGYKTVVSIYSEILAFDFKEKKIIGTYPLNFEYITLFKHNPTEKEIKDIFLALYLGGNPEIKTNILDYAAEQIAKIRFYRHAPHRLKVSEVSLGERAVEVLQELKADPEEFKTFLAQGFGAYLTSNQGVSVLPYTKGQAIGSKMSARFSNGTVYNMEIPEGDYSVKLTLRNLRAESARERSVMIWAYFAYLNIQITQDDLNEVYFDWL